MNPGSEPVPPTRTTMGVGIHSELGNRDQSSTLRRLAHFCFQSPLYYIRWPLAVVLGVWGAFFWRAPTKDDVVALVEGTSLITLLRRGFPPGSVPSEQEAATSQVREERHYYIDVKTCLLEHVTREPGSTYAEGVVLPIKSWSMSYTKTWSIGRSSSSSTGGGGRSGRSGRSGSDADTSHGETKWEVHFRSFVVNGEDVADPAGQMSFLHVYLVSSAHTKCHIFGNSLVQRILSDELLKDKLMESTWTTTMLHTSLLNGNYGPLTYPRTTANKWMGIGNPTSQKSLIAETHNMAPLGGADHARTERWTKLDLPLADFMLGARHVLVRAMRDNQIPMDLLEALFLSIVMHAVDHVLANRIMWGLNFKLDFFDWERPSTTHDHCEKTAWNFMYVAPTINPFYHNKLWRISKPFYRQLYRGLKKIDTLNVANEVTASIMY